jgi:hypothetical protein
MEFTETGDSLTRSWGVWLLTKLMQTFSGRDYREVVVHLLGVLSGANDGIDRQVAFMFRQVPDAIPSDLKSAVADALRTQFPPQR